jgi:hypothetical protein
MGQPPALAVAVVGAAVFPGFVTPTNLKWRHNQAADATLERAVGRVPGIVERWHRTWESDFEQLRVIVAWDHVNGWHLSISHPTRNPTWEEIRDARYELLPDACTVGMLLPPKAEYVNVHPYCFHLHEVPGDD